MSKTQTAIVLLALSVGLATLIVTSGLLVAAQVGCPESQFIGTVFKVGGC